MFLDLYSGWESTLYELSAPAPYWEPLLYESSAPPSRARLKGSNPLPDVSWTSLLALKESADAFPPLKAAVGGVIAICDIAERTRNSRLDARAIALRVIEIMEVIADAVPDGSDISPPMLDSILKFSSLLREIAYFLDDISRTSNMSRFVNLNRNERLLKDIKRKLDGAYRDFLAASTLRLEVQQTKLARQQTKLARQQMQFAIQQEQFVIQQKQFAVQQAQSHVELQNVSFATARLLLYSRLITFFGRPLRLPYKSHTYPLRPDTQPMLAGQRARGHIRPTLLFRLCMEPYSLRPQGWRLSLYAPKKFERRNSLELSCRSCRSCFPRLP
ncbi:hypothetical protein B0H14DRAFT_2679269 [Mycena olivaceomarginata]|nr:hypothetical protein B0H14DRAFT_2679269 [Mycena olivaceomarginata]